MMMERMLKWGVLLVVVSGVAAGAAAGGSAHAETLTVGAAPSLKPAFQAIVPMF
jgi:ABC-type molybdate transport system substrate-binding protein